MSHDKIDDAMAINYESDLAHWKKRAIDAESALAAQQEPTEPVAIYEGVDMSRYTISWVNSPPLTRETLQSIYDDKNPWPHIPVGTKFYTAPLSGVRAGMLRAAEICRKCAELRWEEHGITESDTNASYYPKAIENEMGIRDEESEDCANAITRAADPVNAEEKS